MKSVLLLACWHLANVLHDSPLRSVHVQVLLFKYPKVLFRHMDGSDCADSHSGHF